MAGFHTCSSGFLLDVQFAIPFSNRSLSKRDVQNSPVPSQSWFRYFALVQRSHCLFIFFTATAAFTLHSRGRGFDTGRAPDAWFALCSWLLCPLSLQWTRHFPVAAFCSLRISGRNASKFLFTISDCQSGTELALRSCDWPSGPLIGYCIFADSTHIFTDSWQRQIDAIG